jgi:hypothetical protein
LGRCLPLEHRVRTATQSDFIRKKRGIMEKPNLHITYSALDTICEIHGVDGTDGSSTAAIPNQSLPLSVTAAQPGAAGTIHGRLDNFTVINNPDRR